MRAALIITGSEVVSGKIQDTNGPFLARNLTAHGVEVALALCVPDNFEHLVSALKYAASLAEVLVVTGGLGPTSDDITAAAIARALNSELEFNEAAWDVCTQYYHKSGRKDIPVSNRKQAEIPLHAKAIVNENGTAAGFEVSGNCGNKSVRVLALPGVPQEMEPMFKTFMLTNLKSELQLFSQSWNIFQMSESSIQDSLNYHEKLLHKNFPKAELSYIAHQGCVRWAISQNGEEAENDALSSYIAEHIVPTLNELFGWRLLYEGESSLASQVVQRYTALRRNLTIAESCTGGLIAREITKISGASAMFRGSLVTYSNESKADLLGVDFRTIERFGAASPQVAVQMAHGARMVFDVHVAASVTGVAGPHGGTPRHPVGHVSFGLSILTSSIANEISLIGRLTELGWTRAPEGGVAVYPGQRRSLELVSEKQFGVSLSREIIQNRSMIYCLGTLAGIADFF